MSKDDIYITHNWTWRGKFIKELTREELIQALSYACQTIDLMRQDHERTMRMWKMCREARGGEP